MEFKFIYLTLKNERSLPPTLPSELRRVASHKKEG